MAETVNDLYNWVLSVSTQIMVILIVLSGTVGTVWKLVLNPVLKRFSSRYRISLARQRYQELMPFLDQFGFSETAAKYQRYARTRRILAETASNSQQRVKRAMKEYFHDGHVKLGRTYSGDNPYRIDLQSASLGPERRADLADALARFIAKDNPVAGSEPPVASATRIVGMKEGNPLLAAEVARILHIPLTLFRGENYPTLHESTDPSHFFDGTVSNGDKVILVDDCTFRGSTLTAARIKCSALGAEVLAVYLLFETKCPEARNRFNGDGIPLKALVTVDDSVLKKLR